MKKTIAILVVMAFALQACAVVQFTADGQEVKGQQRIMYFLQGIAPIGNNKVKAGPAYETKQDILDILITGFTGGFIYSQSVIAK